MSGREIFQSVVAEAGGRRAGIDGMGPRIEEGRVEEDDVDDFGSGVDLRAPRDENNLLGDHSQARRQGERSSERVNLEETYALSTVNEIAALSISNELFLCANGHSKRLNQRQKARVSKSDLQGFQYV